MPHGARERHWRHTAQSSWTAGAGANSAGAASRVSKGWPRGTSIAPSSPPEGQDLQHQPGSTEAQRQGWAKQSQRCPTLPAQGQRWCTAELISTPDTAGGVQVLVSECKYLGHGSGSAGQNPNRGGRQQAAGSSQAPARDGRRHLPAAALCPGSPGGPPWSTECPQAGYRHTSKTSSSGGTPGAVQPAVRARRQRQASSELLHTTVRDKLNCCCA